jgi:hypothetical protein
MTSFIERVVPNENELDTLCRLVDEISATQQHGREHEAVALAEERGKAAGAALSRISRKVCDLIAHRGTVGVIELELGRALERYEPVPPTPLELDSPAEHVLFPLDIMRCAIIGAAAGFSYGYSGQGNANLCDDLMPTKKNLRPGASTRFAVNWHTEDAPYNRGPDNRGHTTCDVISFGYLRNPSQDMTRVNMPDPGKMRPESLQALKAYQFKLLTSYYQKAASSNVDSSTSFVYGSDNWIRFSFARVSEQIDEYRQRANLWPVIEEFMEDLERNSRQVTSNPGDIAFIDNMRVAHARAPLKNPAKFDGSDRWLRRLGIVAEPRRAFLEKFMDYPARRLVNNERLLPYLQSLPMPMQVV